LLLLQLLFLYDTSVPLLQLLGCHASEWLIIKLSSSLVHLDVHEVDFLNLKVQVGHPLVQILHHLLLNLHELVNVGVDVAEEKRHLKVTLVKSKVRIEQREDTPADNIVSGHDIGLKQNEFELETVGGLWFGWDHDRDDILDLEVVVLESTIESFILTVGLVKVDLKVFIKVDVSVYDGISFLKLVFIILWIND
jgi:hypothetical protein